MSDGRVPLAPGAIACGDGAQEVSAHSGDAPSRGANGQPIDLIAIGGRTVEVDAEIAPLVRALNAAGLETVASCSGHGHRPADIALADGREIIVARSFDEARLINRLFPCDINGNAVECEPMHPGKRQMQACAR